MFYGNSIICTNTQIKEACLFSGFQPLYYLWASALPLVGFISRNTKRLLIGKMIFNMSCSTATYVTRDSATSLIN